MPYLFVARTEPVCTPKFSSDNACDKIVACRTHASVVAPCAFTPLHGIDRRKLEKNAILPVL